MPFPLLNLPEELVRECLLRTPPGARLRTVERSAKVLRGISKGIPIPDGPLVTRRATEVSSGTVLCVPPLFDSLQTLHTRTTGLTLQNADHFRDIVTAWLIANESGPGAMCINHTTRLFLRQIPSVQILARFCIAASDWAWSGCDDVFTRIRILQFFRQAPVMGDKNQPNPSAILSKEDRDHLANYRWHTCLCADQVIGFMFGKNADCNQKAMTSKLIVLLRESELHAWNRSFRKKTRGIVIFANSKRPTHGRGSWGDDIDSRALSWMATTRNRHRRCGKNTQNLVWDIDAENTENTL
jgi:hypothetical protein